VVVVLAVGSRRIIQTRAALSLRFPTVYDDHSDQVDVFAHGTRQDVNFVLALEERENGLDALCDGVCPAADAMRPHSPGRLGLR